MVGRVDDLIVEAREFLVTPNLGKSLMRELDKAMIYIRRLVDALEASLGERDTAVAALERVRAIASDPCTEGCCDFCEGKNEGWEMVLQALDGAPEPEDVWEYALQAEGDDEPWSDCYETRELLSDNLDGLAARDDEHLVRRRKAGPWLPVEGESKP